MWLAIAALLAGLSVFILLTSARPTVRSGLVVAALVVGAFGCMFAQGPTAVWRHSGIGAGRALINFGNKNELQNWMNAQATRSFGRPMGWKAASAFWATMGCRLS